MLSQRGEVWFNGYLTKFGPLTDACLEKWKSVCAPNCPASVFDGEGVFLKECNPAMLPVPKGRPATAYSDEMGFRCAQTCNSGGLVGCDNDCVDRCLKYCHIPKYTDNTPVPLFCA